MTTGTRPGQVEVAAYVAEHPGGVRLAVMTTVCRAVGRVIRWPRAPTSGPPRSRAGGSGDLADHGDVVRLTNGCIKRTVRTPCQDLDRAAWVGTEDQL